jgi:integrase
MPDPKKIKLANGKVRYRAVVDIGVDPATGKRRQLTITEDTSKAVKDEVSRIRHQRSAGTFVAPNKLTVNDLLDAWLARKARDVEETTITTHGRSLMHARKHLGHVRIQELTEDHVQEMIDAMMQRGRLHGRAQGTPLAASTVNTLIARLREALGWAVIRKLVAQNVATHVTISLADRKADRKANRRPAPWDVPEVQRFVAGLEGERLQAPLLLSLMGLRPAEVCGLRWQDIDLIAGTLETANTRTQIGNGRVVEKDTKTEAGERTLPLPAQVLAALKRFRAQQAKEKLAAGEAYQDAAYAMVNELGVPLTTRDLRESAYKLMAATGLRRVRLYDARHSCLSYLAVNGVPDIILARWAGHTSAAFTKAKYVHVTADDMRSAAAAWDSFSGGSQAQ